MSNSGSSRFQCPKCLTYISVRLEQIGDRIICPACSEPLIVPENLSDNDQFDDLFDDDADTEFEENPNTMCDESELDTGFLEEINVSSFEPQAGHEETTDEDGGGSKPPAFKGGFDENYGDDPFDYDENKPLKIDGITDDVQTPESFYFKCPTCDSELQVSERQIGQKIYCTDCHSEVRVTRPEKKKKKDPWRRAAKVKKDDSNEELRLEPPVERPEIKPGFGLENVQDDLLAPIVEPEEGPEIQPGSKRTTSENQRVAKRVKKKSKVSEKSITSSVHAEPVLKKPDAKPVSWKQVFELELFRDPDLIIRSIVAVVFLTFAYVMVDGVCNTWGREDLNSGEKFNSSVLPGMGAFICFVVMFWFLTITFSVLMRSVANGFKKVDEWVGFAPAEWLGNFVVILVSCWAALLPGVFFGYIAYKITGVFILLPFFASLTAFFLMPLFLISSFQNESAFNIFSTAVISTFSSQTEHWVAAYKLFAIALAAFVFGLLVLLIPFHLFSFLGAVIQVFSITALSILIGIHARSITPELD